MVAAAAPQQPIPTWLTEAEQRAQPVSSIAYDGGSGTVRYLDLPQAGYLHTLQIVTKISGTFSAAPTNPDPNAYVQGPVQQFRVFVNSEGTLFDCDGFITGLISALQNQYDYGDGKVYPYPQASFTQQPGLVAFNDKFTHSLPLAISLANVSTPIGLYNTALQNLSIRLQERFLPVIAPANQLPGSGLYVGGTLAAAATGQSDVNETYFEPIPYASAQPPLRYIHRWTQFEVPINVSNGTVDVPLTGRQRYLRLIYAVFDGATNAIVLNPNVLTNLQLIYGVQSTPYDETVDQVGSRMRRDYGKLMDSWPGGVYTHDFIQRTHTARDWFDAGRVTNLRARLTFSGAHPGTGSKIVCATEEVLTLNAAGFSQTAQAVAGGMAA
jgi:hypothetical protein